MLRVCLVSGEYPPDRGGVADYTRCLAEGLALRGLGVEVLTRSGRYRPGETAAARAERDAGSGRAAVAPPGGPRVTVYRAVGRWGWATPYALGRLVDLTRPDVLHIQYQTAAYRMHPGINVAAWWLRRTRGVPIAITYHDLRVPYLLPKAVRLREAVTLLPGRHAGLVVATNSEDYARLAGAGLRGRLALVPIGSNIPDAPPPGYDRDAWRESAGIGRATGLVAYFGLLNASKGGLALVEALASLRAAGRDVRLLMIGARVGASDPTNAAYLHAFEAALAARGLDEAVLWTGHVPEADVSAWMHAADVVALPYVDGASFRRGSLLAALAHGAPVVTTTPAWTDPSLPTPPGAPPPLEDGLSARLVTPADGPALAAAMAEVLGDALLAARLAAGGRALAAYFGWEAIAARHEELYRDALLGGE